MNHIIYEGKAKILYAHDEHSMVQFFKDSLTAFNAKKCLEVAGKGAVNNKFSCFIFEMLESLDIRTHHIERIDDRSTLVRRARVLPIEFTLRNYCAGRGMVQRWPALRGDKLPASICELMLKNDAMDDPLISEDQALRFGLITADQLAECKRIIFRVNDILSGYMLACGIILADFKIEFGVINGSIVLVDEISPDTCRLWDKDTRRMLDKDVFRQQTDEDKESILSAYQEAFRRVVR